MRHFFLLHVVSHDNKATILFADTKSTFHASLRSRSRSRLMDSTKDKELTKVAEPTLPDVEYQSRKLTGIPLFC